MAQGDRFSPALHDALQSPILLHPTARPKGTSINLDELTDDQKAQVKACKTTVDIVRLAEESGYELSDAELDVVSDGGWICDLCSDFSPTHHDQPC